MPKSKQNGDHTESSTSPEDPLPYLASNLEEKNFSPHLSEIWAKFEISLMDWWDFYCYLWIYL